MTAERPTTDGAAKRRLTSRDLLRMVFVGDVQISPDGRRVAWVERRIDAEHDRYRSRIMVAPLDGSAPPEPFTAGIAQDKAPRWSPDGRWLAFLSDRPLGAGSPSGRDGSPGPAGFGRPSAEPGPVTQTGCGDGAQSRAPAPFQLYVIPASGGEARPLTRLRYGAGTPLWAPDGRRLAFVAPVDTIRGIEQLGDEDPDEKDPYRRFNRDVQVITRLHYKEDGVGYLENRRRHLLVVPFDPYAADIPRPAALTAGAFDIHAADWAPDGRHLAVVTNPDPESDRQRWTDVYLVPADPPRPEGPFKRLTACDLRIGEVRWAPDGRRLVFAAQELELDLYGNLNLFVLEPDATGTDRWVRRCLTSPFDLDIGNEVLHDVAGDSGSTLAWALDGSGVFAKVSRRGAVHLYWFPCAPRASQGEEEMVREAGGSSGPLKEAVGRPRPLTEGQCVVHDFSVHGPTGQVAVVRIDELNPGDVWAGRLEQDPAAAGWAALRDWVRLSQVNESLLNEVALVKPETFVFQADDGQELDGWLMRPADFEPGRRYPAVVQIHGGPMAMYGYAFFFEFQLLAASGYAVLYTNPRGSQGYGEAFCAAIRGGWGDRDFRDVMSLVDEALRRYPFIDAERLGVAGGSYGGYLTNWIIGHTDRFRAAVSMRSVVNEYSMFGTSDFGYLDIQGLGSAPWEDAEAHLRVSPIQYAARIRTPTLIIHSEMDLRCPIGQAEELYTALKLRGVPVAFVRFAGESHGLSRSGKPWHRVFRLDRIVEWFDRYLKGE